MSKKPAQLSDSLLAARPRKGEARPQSEVAASPTPSLEPSSVGQEASDPQPSQTLGRRRRSKNTMQLNMRVAPESLNRFIELADQRDCSYGDLLAHLLDSYDEAS